MKTFATFVTWALGLTSLVCGCGAPTVTATEAPAEPPATEQPAEPHVPPSEVRLVEVDHLGKLSIEVSPPDQAFWLLESIPRVRPFPYSYTQEPAVTWRRVGRKLLVNDEVVGLDLTLYSADDAAKVLAEHTSPLRSFVYLGAEGITQELADALQHKRTIRRPAPELREAPYLEPASL